MNWPVYPYKMRFYIPVNIHSPEMYITVLINQYYCTEETQQNFLLLLWQPHFFHSHEVWKFFNLGKQRLIAPIPFRIRNYIRPFAMYGAET